MAVDTTVSPYFDDFDKDNNYVKVLFKPGVAVQSRELTQIQSILQNQVTSVSGFFFKDAAKINGPKPIVNLSARTVRLKTTNARNETINVNNFLNTYVVANGSTVLGYVEFVYQADDPVVGDPPSFVMSLKRFNSTDDGMFDQNTELSFYTNYIDALNLTAPQYTALTANDITKNASSTLSTFAKTIILTNPNTSLTVGDLLVHPALTKKLYITEVVSTTQLEVNEAPGINLGGELISYVVKATSPTSIVTQDSATYYKDGYFVTSAQQSVVPDKRTVFPTKLIAFIVDQQIITSDDDPTLLDPALESSNYFATGADRLKVDLNISALDVFENGRTVIEPTLLIPLISFDKGDINYLGEVANDAELEKKLAERTYDESGSYTVNQFSITPEHGLENSANLNFTISSGKAYVGGYPVNMIDTTRITIPKPTTTETKTNFNLNTTYGNYFKVSNVMHSLPNPSDLEAKTMFFELHNTTNPTNANSLVGTIAFKNLEYDNYNGTEFSPQYKLFYHYYSPVREVPATWSAWSTKYNISSADGQYIANVLYTTGNILGNYGIVKAPYYGLLREPDTGGVAYWYSRWVALGRDIAKLKQEFALSFTNINDPDYSRVRSNNKVFLEVINGSPFYDGLINVKKIRSIVGIANQLTAYGSAGTYASPTFYANISTTGINSTSGEAIIFDNNKSTDSLVIPTSKSYVKTIDRIQTSYTKSVTNAIFSGGKFTKVLSGTETFAIGDGLIPASTARANFIVLVKSSATASVPLGTWNFEAGTVTVSDDATTVIIDTGDPTFTGIADILFVVETDGITPRQKTLVTNAVKLIDVKTGDLAYSLGKADVQNFSSIYLLSNVNKYLGNWTSGTTYDYDSIVTFAGAAYYAELPTTDVSPFYSNAWVELDRLRESVFLLDDGQRDNFYDHGSIKYIGAGAGPGNVLVTFSYYTHTGEGPVTVNSYPATEYARLPTYRSVIDAQEYVLRDCLDFRPRRVDDLIYQDYDPAIIPNSTVTTEADITYYLGRKDRIYVTNDLQNFNSPYNKFYIEQGKEALNSITTIDSSDITKLSIATLDIPPFSVDSMDVKIVYDDSKRFTMRDIAKIENLTIQLDKSVKLHSVEISNLKGIITGDNGESLLKSGILVENFDDFETADLTSPYFSVSIDVDSGECFPSFGCWNVDLLLPETAPTGIFAWQDIITMEYEEELYVNNLSADSTLIVNPAGINDGKGRANLSKKNSFSINPLLAGGLMVAGYVAFKTYSVIQAGQAFGFANGGYGQILAYQAESTLAVAWGQVQALGLAIKDAFLVVDAFMNNIGPYRAVKAGFSRIYDKLIGGATDIIPGETFGNTIGSSLFGATAWTQLTAGFELVTSAASGFITGTQTATYSYSLLSQGFSSLASGAFLATYGQLATAASVLAAKTAGVPILGSAMSYISTNIIGTAGAGGAGATGAYAWILQAGPFAQAAVAVAAVYVAVKYGGAIVKGAVKLAKKIVSFLSDIRTKTKIMLVGKMRNGLNLYSFEYKKKFKHLGGHGQHLGYIAQEVEKRYPKAVKIESHGYKVIDYSLIGH